MKEKNNNHIMRGMEFNMEKIQNISDIAKETITFLAFWDEEMIKKIPDKVISKLCEEAAESNLDFYVETTKSFEEQEISEKSKDLMSLIYYSYVAGQDEKSKILHQWNQNEKIFQNEQNNKYNPEELFRKRPNLEQNSAKETMMIEHKKDSIFQKIKTLLRRIFK